VVGRSDPLASGESQALTMELEPGTYELSCSIVEEFRGERVSHYAEGMTERFVVLGES
jgi:hypothetical protein